MDNIVIKYSFKLPDDTKEEFVLTLDRKTLECIRNDNDPPPDWARLDFCPCSHCSLDAKQDPYCPLMMNLAGIVKSFDKILSHEKVFLKVVTEERHIAKKTTAQRALSSLMGLVIAASGCPHTLFFKPMARFHLPLANAEETLYRAASAYLLSQYFRKKKDKNSENYDLEGLRRIYKDMQTINAAIAERLRAASYADSTVNAIVLLDIFAKAVPFFIEDSLKEIRYLFSSYID